MLRGDVDKAALDPSRVKVAQVLMQLQRYVRDVKAFQTLVSGLDVERSLLVLNFHVSLRSRWCLGGLFNLSCRCRIESTARGCAGIRCLGDRRGSSRWCCRSSHVRCIRTNRWVKVVKSRLHLGIVPDSL